MAAIDTVLVAGVGVLVVTVFYTYRLAMKAKLHYAHERDRAPAEMATFEHRIRKELQGIRTEISKLTSTQSAALSESKTHTNLLGQMGGLGVARELHELNNEVRAFEKRLRELELKSQVSSLEKKFREFERRRKKAEKKPDSNVETPVETVETKIDAGEAAKVEASATKAHGESVTANGEQPIETKVGTLVETAIMKREAERILSRLPSEKSFHFYITPRQPTDIRASSLKEFCDLIKIIDVKSVEFDTFSGDFEKWFTHTLNYPRLAQDIANIREAGISGGELREQIYKIAKKHYDQLNRLIK